MVRVNYAGYLERKTSSGNKSGYRNWWLVKYFGSQSNIGIVTFKTVYLPQMYVGKKIRFKVEIIE